MQFDSLAALWAMNGHGPFVWSAYAIAAATLIALIWLPLRKQRRLLSELRARQSAEQRRQAAASSSESR